MLCGVRPCSCLQVIATPPFQFTTDEGGAQAHTAGVALNVLHASSKIITSVVFSQLHEQCQSSETIRAQTGGVCPLQSSLLVSGPGLFLSPARWGTAAPPVRGQAGHTRS